MKRLALVDIDGTLIRCGPQVRPIFCGAMTEVFGGFPSLDGFDFSGKTDPQIVLELARAQGFDDRELHLRMPAMRAAYHRRMIADFDPERARVLPHAHEMVSRLSAPGNGVTVGLLTGNWRVCAEIKLTPFDLWHAFPFGAFGDDAVDRRALLPIARERAARTSGIQVAPEDVLIIGDSRRDVDCAHAGGARCLAVATGFTSEATLRDAGADWVYPDLTAALADHPWLRG